MTLDTLLTTSETQHLHGHPNPGHPHPSPLSSPSQSTDREEESLVIGFTVKKLKVDLTLKRSSQLQHGFIQVQVVVQLLLQGFSLATLVH